jgi:hypothetical protein
MNAINRILNIPLSIGLTRQSNTKDRDPNQGGSYKRQGKERQPSEDEAKKAFQILLELESIKKNNLSVELKTDDSVQGTAVFVILVKDASGALLRGIRGPDILKIVEQGPEKKSEHPENGRILDRRI